MADEITSKYKLFRNYMANELQITKRDIHEWVDEAVEREVKVAINRMRLDLIIERKLASNIHSVHTAIAQKVADNLSKSLSVSVVTNKP